MKEEYLNDIIRFFETLTNLPKGKITINCSNLANINEESLMILLAQLEKESLLGNKTFCFSHSHLLEQTLLKYNYPTTIGIYKKISAFILSNLKPFIDFYINDNTTEENFEHLYNRINDKFHFIHPNTPLLGEFEKSKTVNVEYIAKITEELNTIYTDEIFQPLYDLLIELTGNAAEHGIMEKNINWWMHRYVDIKNPKKMHYVFVDMGCGIINSYINIDPTTQYTFSKSQIPLASLKGQLGSTTKKQGRGNGMPLIMDNIEKEWISNFVLITNGVSLRYINGHFKISENQNFIGTYYSWTIDENNYLKWKNTL